jgi:AraC family transcriptional regulator of adaptative response / DNA-3-methyladenine glycosylase II
MAAASVADPRLFTTGESLESGIKRLVALTGIGEWTACYIAMRALREPDAFPAADIGLLRALADVNGARPNGPSLQRGPRLGARGEPTPRCIFGWPSGARHRRPPPDMEIRDASHDRSAEQPHRHAPARLG